VGSQCRHLKYIILLDIDAKMNLESESMSAFPVANFDPFGLVFGVAWSEQQKEKQIVRICIYDIENC
jgi:hypothetical protein